MYIRKAQISGLSPYMRERFAERMEAHLRECYPEETAELGHAQIRALIDQGIERADQYGLITERETAHFIGLMVALDPEFDTEPDMAWAQEILRDDSLEGEEKIGRITDLLPDKLRQLLLRESEEKRS